MSYWIHEFDRADEEVFHQKGRECWMVKGKITVNKRRGKIFGIVNEDSMAPEKLVEVAVHDKEKWMNFENGEKNAFRKFKHLRRRGNGRNTKRTARRKSRNK